MGRINSGVFVVLEDINYNNRNIIVLNYINYFLVGIGLVLWFRK